MNTKDKYIKNFYTYPENIIFNNYDVLVLSGAASKGIIQLGFIHKIKNLQYLSKNKKKIILSKYIYDNIKGFKPISVTVWETPKNSATYER